MLIAAMRRKLDAHTDDDRPALQSVAGNWPTLLTQQAATDASSGSRQISSMPFS
ncbi:hypothetical protein [Pseudomonas mosselii]|uniref:hypothetical protein n=1 Tax=Pseudomonas mosselii TaxID=78327 RepID=UPI003F3A3E35